MPNPKRRHSNARTRKRRTHHKIPVQPLSLCPNCGEEKRSHYICPSCGYYKGRPVLTIKQKTKSKKK